MPALPLDNCSGRRHDALASPLESFCHKLLYFIHPTSVTFSNCNAQDGSEYQSVTHTHTTSTSAHINPPPDPVPLDTSDPYSKKADEEPAQRSGGGGQPRVAR